MKKCILIVVSLIIIVLLVIIAFVVKANQRIPIIEGLYFGMTPKQAEKVLGKHSEIEYNFCDTGKNAYTYKTAVLGKPATVTCFFLDDRKLTEIEVCWDGDVEGLYEQLHERVYDQYHSNMHFFEKPATYSDTDGTRSSMGIDNGVTGVFYEFCETETSLRVYCINLK